MSLRSQREAQFPQLDDGWDLTTPAGLFPRPGDEVHIDDDELLIRRPERDAVIARLVKLGLLQVVEHSNFIDDEQNPWVEYGSKWHMTSFGVAFMGFLINVDSD
jgi:hypothetical protein